MAKLFQEGDTVVHKASRVPRMVVVEYTGDDTVKCSWHDVKGFQEREFKETELKKPGKDFGTGPVGGNPPRPW